MRNVEPWRILAVTFTNKAAREMRERLDVLLGPDAQRLTVSTFHSFGLSVLQAETKALGFRGGKFVIFDQGDSSGVVREALRAIRTDKTFDVGAILARISDAKNAFLEAEAWEDRQRKGKGVDDYDEVAMLCYPLAAGVCWAIARRLYDERVAFWSAIAVLTLPMFAWLGLFLRDPRLRQLLPLRSLG